MGAIRYSCYYQMQTDLFIAIYSLLDIHLVVYINNLKKNWVIMNLYLISKSLKILADVLSPQRRKRMSELLIQHLSLSRELSRPYINIRCYIIPSSFSASSFINSFDSVVYSQRVTKFSLTHSLTVLKEEMLH